MNSKFTVCVDWDDVLCQCNGYLIEEINKEHGTTYTLDNITKWGELGDPLLDGRFMRMTRKFHENTRMFTGAKLFIKELERLGGEVFIMTAIHADQAAMRMERIMKEFPNMKPENIIFGARKDLVKTDFMLDDACHNILTSTAKYPVLFRRPWNAHCTGLMAVNDYEGFLTLVRTVIFPKERTYHDGPIVLVGPTGSGKTEVAAELVKDSCFERVPSCTTKKGIDPKGAYEIVTEFEFELLDEQGAFLEKTIYANRKYAIKKESVDKILDDGKRPVMVLDICGAMSVKEHYPNSVLIFIERNKEECFKEVLSRNYSIEEMANRLASFDGELKNKQFCDLAIKHNNGAETIKAML